MNTRKIYTLTIIIISFLLLTFLVVKNNSFLIGFDNSVNSFFVANQSPIISNLMLSVTKICDPFEAITILVIFGIFLIMKNKKHFYSFIVATFSSVILSYVIKHLIIRVRPTSNLLIEHGYSFPSSHATIATVFLLSSIYYLAPNIKKVFSKNIFLISTSIIFPLVALSREIGRAHV